MTDEPKEHVPSSPAVSPLFAREAARMLDRGELSEALRLCEQGRERYPWYATASFILGRCLEELGRTGEAVLEYRRVLELLPDNRAVRDGLERVERREQTEFQAFAEQQTQALKREKNSRTFEEFLREGGVESAVEFLARKPQPSSQEQTSGATAPGEAPGAGESSSEIVTVTLAEIYAAQGQYGEAIAAYRKLMERRPEEADQFRRRIVELEDLAAAAESEKPLQQ